jgi:hypothetical protein
VAQIYDKIDCFWTSQGDYYISDGDILDTSHDPLRSLVQEIRTRTESDQGDWEVFETVGGNIRDSVGEPNTPATAEATRVRLLAAYARDGFINSKDMSIQYMPVDRDKLLMRLKVKVAPTPENGNSETLTVAIVYNYSDNNVYFIGA